MGGVPDTTADSGMVSSGGSTPSTGAGSVQHGSGSDIASDPEPSGTTTPDTTASDTTGSTDTVSEPIPGVIVRSSGGALTSAQYAVTSTPAEETVAEEPVEIDLTASTSVAPQTLAAGSVEAPTSAAGGDLNATVPSQVSGVDGSPLEGPDATAVNKRTRLVVPAVSLTPVTASVTAAGGYAGPMAQPSATGLPLEVQTISARGDSASDAVARPPMESLRIVTGVLAAALAPFIVPVPGSPVQEPTLWAVFAWARRQSERGMFSQRSGPLPAARLTELVTVPESAPSTIDRVDQVTGRVSGGVGGAAGVTYALAGQLDRRLGRVTVDGDTGRWTFAPSESSRLDARLGDTDDVAEFSILASDGTTFDVSAPVSPAEAAVTGTIDVGEGLTYGLAVVGDRLYVLNSSYDTPNPGRVKVIETSSGAVIGSIEVGSMPSALVARGQALYVGNAGDGTVSVVDVLANRVVDVIDVGATPIGLEVAGGRLYVADHAGTVSLIDLHDNAEVARIPVAGDPFGLVATANRVYVTDYLGSTVAVFDQTADLAHYATAGVEPVGVPDYPYVAAVVGSRLYVVNSAMNALTVVDGTVATVVDVDPATRAVDGIPDDAAPADIVVRGDRLYASNVNCGNVTVVDVATNLPVATVRVGIQPGLLTATPDGRTIYVADVMDGTIRVITSVHPALAHATG